jgi:hypothetical protein
MKCPCLLLTAFWHVFMIVLNDDATRPNLNYLSETNRSVKLSLTETTDDNKWQAYDRYRWFAVAFV